MSSLKTTYLGLELKNPLIIASSGLTSSVEKIAGLEKAGAAAVVVKSLFEEQINNEVGHLFDKNPQNNEYPEAEDYIRNYLRDNSVTGHLELVRATKKAVEIPVIASINCISSSEWVSFAREFEEAGADALELNIFYVPTDRNERPGMVEQLYLDILSKVKKEVKIPVSVKIGMYFTNIVAMADKLKANGASGIVLFNRFYEPDINLETLELTASEVFSSPADLHRSLRWIGLVSSFVPHLDIAGSTGIHNSDAVVKHLLAGSQAAQLCSAVYLNGPGEIVRILDGIREFMGKWNFETIGDFRGRLSYKNIPDPMMYERSQFMKYFSSKK